MAVLGPTYQTIKFSVITMEKFKDKISTGQLVEEYLKGNSVEELAQRFDVSHEAVYQRLRKDRDWKYIKAHMRKQRALERTRELQEKSDEIVEGWLAGVSILDLAKEFQTSRKNISRIIKDVVGSTKRRYKRDLEIVEKYKQGATQTKLAKEYGISQPCVSRIVNALYEEDEE